MRHNTTPVKKANKNGFTLIEILIIFGISSVILGVSVNSFGSYNSTQKFRSAVSDVVNELNSARSKAISQVKPSQCTSSLDGYEVKITTSGRDYEQSALCGGLPYATKLKKLPAQVNFVNGSAPSVPFNVSTGTVNAPRTIAITGFGKTTTIHINATGIVSSTDGLSLIGIPTATATPPTATATPPTATATPPTGVATAVALNFSPNPSTITQQVTFNVAVTGTSCTPLGFVYFYQNGVPFAATALSGTNPQTGTAGYAFTSPGIRTIRAQYYSYSTCPSASSPSLTHTVQ